MKAFASDLRLVGPAVTDAGPKTRSWPASSRPVASCESCAVGALALEDFERADDLLAPGADVQRIRAVIEQGRARLGKKEGGETRGDEVGRAKTTRW